MSNSESLTADQLQSAMLAAPRKVREQILSQLAKQQLMENAEARVPEYGPVQLAELQRCLNTLDNAVDADLILEELRQEAESARSHES